MVKIQQVNGPGVNGAYLSAFGTEPPARITVGRNGLALAAAVELDCVAFLPDAG